jgi:uncharacterized membrane protein YphA (DoxX/SURF4 family)
MNPKLLFALRLTLGAIWLYNGLWLKIVATSPEHLAVVSGLNLGKFIQPHTLLTLIGVGETMLATAIWSGLFNRYVSWFQFGILLATNFIAILFSGAIAQPMQLIFQNLTMYFCIVIMAIYGPGFFFDRRA